MNLPVNMYNPAAWYWAIAGSTTQVFSSASGKYVPLSDAAYVAWLAQGFQPSNLPTEDELIANLEIQAPNVVVLSKAGLIAYAAKARYAKEIAGITVSGVPVLTDDRAKQMIMGARIAADANPAFTTKWVGADGNIYPLTATQMIGISDAVMTYVAACFGVFATVQAAINAGTMTTPAQIDAAFAAQ